MHHPRPVRLRRHPRHPAGRLLPRAEPGEARERGRRVHHHGRLAGGPPEPPARAGRHPRAVRQPAHGHRRRARQARRTRAAERLDLGLLRLGQVELREAARPRARRRRAARRHFARRGAARAATRRRCATSFATPGTSSARRSTRSPSSSTSAASPATTSTSTPRPCGRSSSGSATARPSRSSPTSSSGSSATASGTRFERDRRARRSARPGPSVKDKQLAEEDFSLVLSDALPGAVHRPDELVHEPRRDAPAARVARGRRRRDPRHAQVPAPRATLFLVVDEVSQYVLSNKDRVDRLRAFATALGPALKGKAWLLALGQQKLDEEADDSFLVWAKDRFPPKLRVHLAADEHPRRRPQAPAPEDGPRSKRSSATLFEQHRADLKLFAYGCDDDHRGRVRRGLPDAAGAHRSAPADHQRAAHALGPGAGRRPGDPRPAAAARRAVPRPEARRHARSARSSRSTRSTRCSTPRSTPTCRRAWRAILDQCANDPTGLLARVAKAVALLELIQDDAADRREAGRAVPLRPRRSRQPA